MVVQLFIFLTGRVLKHNVTVNLPYDDILCIADTSIATSASIVTSAHSEFETTTYTSVVRELKNAREGASFSQPATILFGVIVSIVPMCVALALIFVMWRLYIAYSASLQSAL